MNANELSFAMKLNLKKREVNFLPPNRCPSARSATTFQSTPPQFPFSA
jgi:hypothetical protein